MFIAIKFICLLNVSFVKIFDSASIVYYLQMILYIIYKWYCISCGQGDRFITTVLLSKDLTESYKQSSPKVNGLSIAPASTSTNYYYYYATAIDYSIIFMIILLIFIIFSFNIISDRYNYLELFRTSRYIFERALYKNIWLIALHVILRT